MKCCHGNNNNQEQNGKLKGLISHMWMMILCCGAPIILIVLLPLLAKINPGVGAFLSKVTPYLCPVLMLAMIPMMLFSHKGRNKGNACCDNKQMEDKT
jgi:branched-subunit amino acid transport protein